MYICIMNVEKIIELKDVLHHYKGHPFEFTYKNGDKVYGFVDAPFTHFLCGEGLLMKFNHNKLTYKEYYEVEPFSDKYGSFKLILRPADLERLTISERNYYESLLHKVKDTDGETVYKVDTPLSINYLMQIGIDLFDLIQNDIAIDARGLSVYLYKEIKKSKKTNE